MGTKVSEKPSRRLRRSGYSYGSPLLAGSGLDRAAAIGLVAVAVRARVKIRYGDVIKSESDDSLHLFDAQKALSGQLHSLFCCCLALDSGCHRVSALEGDRYSLSSAAARSPTCGTQSLSLSINATSASGERVRFNSLTATSRTKPLQWRDRPTHAASFPACATTSSASTRRWSAHD